MPGFRVGIDIGGTFTDIVLVGEDGAVRSRKVPSSVDDYARAIVDGLLGLLEEHQLEPGAIAEVLHGTTVASNAILEQRGARVGLIGTDGFRDVLEIRNLRMPRLYDLAWEKPPPLVERYLRVVVSERVDARGEVLHPLDPGDAGRAVDRLLAEGVETIAVCLLNAYANPVHERLIAEVLRSKAPDLPVSISHEVLPEIKEYERTSTTVVNAYVLPLVSRYLGTLRAALDRRGIRAPVLLMQSNGGLTPSEEAARNPVNIIESGPAAGVVGAQAVAARAGVPDVISFDMGGTTAKASLIEGGELTRSAEYSVGGGIMLGTRLLTGGGYLVKVPAIDLAEVGAGGGSIVWVDPGGSLRVGPRSAGAHPGPACYGLGGTEPTITDANVVLGYLNPDHLCGGAVALDAERSHRALRDGIAARLGLDLDYAAYAAHRIAGSSMIRAIRAVSSERGRDPRACVLLCFGGNGPLFGAAMARELGIRALLVPPSAGLFSALGLLFAEVEHHYARTVGVALREADPGALDRIWGELEARARAQLAADGFAAPAMRLVRTASMHYRGQSYELPVPVPGRRLGPADLPALEEAFGAEHERTYGHRAERDEPVEIVNVRLVAQGVAEPGRAPVLRVPREGSSPPVRERRAYHGPEAGWLETPVLRRLDLEAGVEGPCIVEEYDSTCLVPPGAHARLDEGGNLRIELAP